MTGKGIRIEGVSKRYGKGDTSVDALKQVDMQVAPGEVVGLPALAKAPCLRQQKTDACT